MEKTEFSFLGIHTEHHRPSGAPSQTPVSLCFSATIFHQTFQSGWKLPKGLTWKNHVQSALALIQAVTELLLGISVEMVEERMVPR